MKALNSTSLSLFVAIDLPSHGGTEGGAWACKRPPIVPAGGLVSPVTPKGVCANGLTLKNK